MPDQDAAKSATAEIDPSDRLGDRREHLGRVEVEVRRLADTTQVFRD